jgi:hypothetical protein
MYMYITNIGICAYISRVLGEVVFESGNIARGGSCYYDSRVLQQGEKPEMNSQILSLPFSSRRTCSWIDMKINT